MKPTTWQGLEELRAAVDHAKDRVAALDAARQAGARRVERARAELLDYYRAEGRGEDIADPPTDVDLGEPSTEERLLAALREAEGGLALRAVQRPQGDGQADVALEAVDEAAEARYAGAVELLEQREAELRQYATRHLTELFLERAPLMAGARDRVATATEEARAAAHAWERLRASSVELLTLAGREELIEEIPANPLACMAQADFPAAPMPQSFVG